MINDATRPGAQGTRKCGPRGSNNLKFGMSCSFVSLNVFKCLCARAHKLPACADRGPKLGKRNVGQRFEPTCPCLRQVLRTKHVPPELRNSTVIRDRGRGLGPSISSNSSKCSIIAVNAAIVVMIVISRSNIVVLVGVTAALKFGFRHRSKKPGPCNNH